MIENIEIIGGGKYKIEDNFKKYAEKRLGKLDKFLPSKHRKDASIKNDRNVSNRAVVDARYGGADLARR